MALCQFAAGQHVEGGEQQRRGGGQDVALRSQAIAHPLLIYRILLAAVAIFSLYSVHLLLKTANEGGECGWKIAARMFWFFFSARLNVSSPLKGALVYEQLGYKAFGIPGKLAASCSITMQNIGGETPLRFFVVVTVSLFVAL